MTCKANNQTAASISVSHDGNMVFIFSNCDNKAISSASTEIVLDTRDIHCVVVNQSSNDNGELKQLRFVLDKNDVELHSAVYSTHLFDMIKCTTGDWFCVLRNTISCVIFDSAKRYTSFPMDTCNDFVCIQEPSYDNGDLIYVNLNQISHFSIHCSNLDLSKDFMFEFKKLPDGDFGLKKGNIYDINHYYAKIVIGGYTDSRSVTDVDFEVKLGHIIDVFNKQMYGSSQSFRARMMKRRLAFMTAKMMQLQQIGYFLDMPTGLTNI
jgi:hypothetical protein